MDGTKIRALEELSLNAHPSLNTMYYDGWVLRFADGYTNRANSVNMLYSSQLPLADKIDFCESLYSKQALPTVFKVTPISINIDNILAERGYSVVTPTNLMTMDIPGSFSSDFNSAVVSVGVNEEWQDNYFRLNQTNARKISVAKQIQCNIMNCVLTATLSDENEVAACGLCVVEQDYAGLYDIIVSLQSRRKGFGRDVCTSLINNAINYGAKKVYLQVVADNAGAVELYKKLGFADMYQYWYRVKNI